MSIPLVIMTTIMNETQEDAMLQLLKRQKEIIEGTILFEIIIIILFCLSVLPILGYFSLIPWFSDWKWLIGSGIMYVVNVMLFIQRYRKIAFYQQMVNDMKEIDEIKSEYIPYVIPPGERISFTIVYLYFILYPLLLFFTLVDLPKKIVQRRKINQKIQTTQKIGNLMNN